MEFSFRLSPNSAGLSRQNAAGRSDADRRRYRSATCQSNIDFKASYIGGSTQPTGSALTPIGSGRPLTDRDETVIFVDGHSLDKEVLP